MKRRLWLILTVILLAVMVLAGAGLYVVRRPFPQVSGTLAVPGLQSPVQVIRDRWGVPHLYAQNTHDLVFAQGFVHAQDRLWQMEVNRRTATGSLSEIFGEATLGTDRFLRTIGLARAAEADAAVLDRESADAIAAYAAGVNAFILQAGSRLPIEFAILRSRPELWKPTDTLAYGKLMAWVLGGNWESELLRAHFVARFGAEGAAVLMPPYPGDAPVIAPEAVEAYRALNAYAVGQLLRLGARPAAAGSNNWVVAGTRTATGLPLLANDPHLEIAMPSIWYEMHLVGGPYDVTGSTFPGVPGVIIGHNASIVWGVTNAGPDVQDLYLERFHPADPNRYLYKGQWEPVRIVRETIRVKGRAQPVVETVRITRHGPLLNGVVRGLGAFMAFRWTALTAGSPVTAILQLDRARNWEEFRTALRSWTVPAQNFVYADRDGNIGYQLPGRIPIRAKGDGTLPVPGWTGEYEWTGEIPFERLPSIYNPPRGYIATANNQIAPPGYPYLIALEWDPGFRARRIETQLAGTPRASVDLMQAMQADVTSLPARATVRALADMRLTTEPAAGLLADLRSWDGNLTADSRGAVIYEAFRVAVLDALFQDVVDPDLYVRYLRQQHFWQVALLRLLQDAESQWWGPDGRDAVVAHALERAANTLTSQLGADRSRWSWGRLHRTRFVHPLGRVPALAWIFNAAAPPVGGDGFTVNNTAYDPRTFEQVIVASYRQIIDLADWDRSITIHTTGQSGQPFHSHYRDFVPLWATGRYHTMAFSRPRVEQEARDTLVLTPRP